MRVLEYFPALRAGMGAYGESLASALANTGEPGDSVHVACGGASWSEPDRLARVRSVVDLAEIRGDPRSGSALRKFYDLHLGQYRDVTRLARRLRPDVVHMHFGLYLTDWMLPMAVRRTCPVILTVHDPVPHRWILPDAIASLDRRIHRWRYAAFDRFIVHSATGRDVLVRELGVSADRIDVIAHGSDVETLAPLRRRPREKSFAVLGGLRAKKRVLEVIEAFQHLPGSFRAEWRLRIAGVPESASYAAAIRDGVARDPQGIELSLRELGDREFDDVLASAGFAVLAYQDFASMSGILLRAMASGTIPLITAACSLADQAPEQLVALSIGGNRTLSESLAAAASLYGTARYTDLQEEVVRHSQQFDWRIVAHAHWRTFRSTAAAASGAMASHARRRTSAAVPSRP